MSDFNWDGDDEESVILVYQPRTAVYASRGGNVIVRQEKDAYEEDDPQLLFTPQGALAAAWEMIRTAHSIGLPVPPLLEMGADSAQAREVPAQPSGPVVHRPAPAEPGPLLAVMEAAKADGEPRQAAE